MAFSISPARAIFAIVSILVAVAAVLYASLLPDIPPMRWRASKITPALSNLTSKFHRTADGANATMATKPPVYFFSHGGPDVMYKKDHPVYPVLQKIGKEITSLKPKAVVVFSAHWQAKPDLIQVNNALMTDLIYEFVRPRSRPSSSTVVHSLSQVDMQN